MIETCYATHHLQFDNDPDQTVYFNELSGPIIGWINTKVYDQTLASTKDELKAEQAAVGWCCADRDVGVHCPAAGARRRKQARATSPEYNAPPRFDLTRPSNAGRPRHAAGGALAVTGVSLAATGVALAAPCDNPLR